MKHAIEEFITIKSIAVAGKCILMYAPPVEGFHAWHRALYRVFAKL
jgi:hypothetical protein